MVAKDRDLTFEETVEKVMNLEPSRSCTRRQRRARGEGAMRKDRWRRLSIPTSPMSYLFTLALPSILGAMMIWPV